MTPPAPQPTTPTATLASQAVAVLGNNSGGINTGYQIILNYHEGGGRSQSKETLAAQVAGYLAWLRDSSQNIVLRGIEKAGGAPVVELPLETAYVPLRAHARPRVGEPKRTQEQDESGPQDIALNQVLGLGNHLVILGGPGSGKTTVLLHMAWALAVSLLENARDPAASRLGLTLDADRLPLPIFVPLAAFARYRRGLAADAPAPHKTLAHFISHHLIVSQAHFSLPDDFFTTLLREGRDVLLLLDGLDEVANEDERAEISQAVENLVHGRPAMRVIVTCRPIAYHHGRTALGADFRVIEVQALEHEAHIDPMVRQAYVCIHPKDATLARERADDLLNGILALERERRARLGDKTEALVDSPLMVRLLLIVHLNDRALPNERADLFNKAINALLQVDYGHDVSVSNDLKADWEQLREMAQHLAWHMHQQGRDQGREIEEAQLKAILRQEEEFKPRIGQFLHQARQRGSVMEERGGAYRFIHLAFQEFLVCSYLYDALAAVGRQGILADLAEHLDDPWWREPILLLAGYRPTKNSKGARDFIQALAQAGHNANTRFAAAELAASAALEWRDSGAATRAACAQRIVNLLQDPAALKESRAPLRALAGDALSRLGDPRFDPARWYLPAEPNLGFVRIEADPDFRIGTRREDKQRINAHDHEINDQPTPTLAFYIARYPVTVAQFRAFVAAGNYKPGNPDALREPDSRPLRYVSFTEALDYCAWLQQRLAESDGPVADLLRQGGWRLTLPSELEWEKAARGGHARLAYPWGDEADPEKANYADTGIGDTSAVGCFPANDYGLFDMSGNVWEWTRSLWQPYPYTDIERREDLNAKGDRFVRGGAWCSLRGLVRCAIRGRRHPDVRNDYLGFRVVLSPV